VLVEIQLVSCPGGCGVYARDDRPWWPRTAGRGLFLQFDRKAERPAAHLQDFRGVLQVDAGFERLASKPHLQHPSGQFLLDFKEMLLMLTYLAAVRRLFWLMGKVSTHALAQVT
jgi:hypothetical protein